MEISFKGKRALVTGASRGIGREIAKKLAQCGAKVTALARNKTLLETLKAEVPSIDIIQCDLSNWRATAQALNSMGPVDLLVNNAGIAIIKPLTEMQESDIDQLFNTNTKALIHITQFVAKSLLERKAPGSIVNVSSQTAKIGLRNHSVYGSTKGAVDAYTRAAALELGPFNIRVNCVNPTVIDTEMTKIGFPTLEVAKPMMEKIPLGRFGEVGEVADAVLFLLSDKASMITGCSLLVDGGYVAV